MNIPFVVLLFVSAAGAINNLVGLPDERFQQIEHLLKDKPLAAKPSRLVSTAGLGDIVKRVQLDDFYRDDNITGPSVAPDVNEGSGVKPAGETGVIREAVENMVDSLHKIIPAIKTLKDARDKQNHVYATEFVEALKYQPDDEHVKTLLGQHIISLHRRCMAIKLAFAKHAHQTGLLDSLGNDNLDFTEVMGQVLQGSENHEADIFEAFIHKVHEHGIQDHPGVKVIMAIGDLVTDAACEVKMDGLLGTISELIQKEDPAVDFEMSLGNRVISFLYNNKSKTCSGVLLDSLKPNGSLKERILNLIFGRCREVKLVRFTVNTVMNAIQLRKQVALLQISAHKRTMAMSQKVTSLMKSGLFDEAHEVIGDFVLTEIRRALLVDLAVHELASFGITPTGPKPSGPLPSGPRPSEPNPSSPVPSGPRPSEPKPSSPVPSGPRPSEPKPSSPVPSGPRPSEPKPSSPVPSGPRPSEPKPSSPVPSGPRPSEPKPSSPVPSGPRPSEPNPSSPVPSRPLPSSPRPSKPGLSGPAPSPSSGPQADFARRAAFLQDEFDFFRGRPAKTKRYHKQQA